MRLLALLLLATLLTSAEPPVIITMAYGQATILEDAGPQLFAFSVANVRDGQGRVRFDEMRVYPVDSSQASLFLSLDTAYQQGSSLGYIASVVQANRSGGPIPLILFAYDSVSQSVVAATSFSLTITPVNDLPTLAVNEPLAVGMGGTATYALTDLLIADVDEEHNGSGGSATLAITVVTPPAHGDLRRDAVPLAAGDRFTTKDVKDGRITYRNRDGDGDQWQFTWSDGIAPEQGPAWATIWVAGKSRPVLFLPTLTFNWQESDTPLVFADEVRVEDGDSAAMTGGSITASITFGAAAGDYLTIAHQGAGNGQIGIDGHQVSYGGIPIGTWSGGTWTGSGSGTDLVVALSGTACTPAAVQAVVRALRFGNAGGNPGNIPRTIAVVVNDGDAGASAPVSVRVSVVPIDTPPVIAARTIATGAGLARPVQFTVSDPDSGAFTWSVAVPPAQGDLTVLDAASGRFLFTPHADAVGADVCTVAVHADRNTATCVVPISVIGRNDPRLLPLADPPRSVVAGETLTWTCAWQAASPATYPLEAVLAGDVPAGLAVATDGADVVTVTWLVPLSEPTGSHRFFTLLVSDADGILVGALPWSLLVRPRPGGGG